MSTSDQHTYSTEDLGDRWRHACTCGFQTYAWEKRFHPVAKQADPNGCPQDPTVRALATLQFAWGGMFDSKPADGYTVHLVRSTNRGTPGPTLCGIDRMAKDTPGWSVGGGMTGPTITHQPCPGCVASARTEFAGIPVIARHIGAAEISTAIANQDAVAAR